MFFERDLNIKQKTMLDMFTNMLLNDLQVNINGKQKSTFGFEIEFLPVEIIDIKQVERICLILPGLGFKNSANGFISDTGLCITFEPGGQIEFCSPPIEGSDFPRFDDFLNQIAETNGKIFKRLGIKYRCTSFIPNRGGIDLCLEGTRYRFMHKRFKTSGTRGREMMKGTAAVHLHAGLQSLKELPAVYKTFCRLSKNKDFSMSDERRDIWQNTDPERCKMPDIDINHIENNPGRLIKGIVHHALSVEDLYSSIPLYETNNIGFDYFKEHLTTLFPDVRLNLKGPSLELRTPDSRPLPEMAKTWSKFISIVGALPDII